MKKTRKAYLNEIIISNKVSDRLSEDLSGQQIEIPENNPGADCLEDAMIVDRLVDGGAIVPIVYKMDDEIKETIAEAIIGKLDFYPDELAFALFVIAKPNATIKDNEAA